METFNRDWYKIAAGAGCPRDELLNWVALVSGSHSEPDTAFRQWIETASDQAIAERAQTDVPALHERYERHHLVRHFS